MRYISLVQKLHNSLVLIVCSSSYLVAQTNSVE